MVGLSVVLFPFLLMGAALCMERVESRLRRTGLAEDEVAQFLDQVSAADVQTVARDGVPRALDVFRLRHHHPRRVPQRRRTAVRHTTR